MAFPTSGTYTVEKQGNKVLIFKTKEDDKEGKA